MTIEISYTEARNNFASVLDRVVDDGTVIIIDRPGHKKVALISTAELARIREVVSLSASQKDRYTAVNEIVLAEERKRDYLSRKK